MGKNYEYGYLCYFFKKGKHTKIEDKEVNVVGRDVVSGTVLVDNSNYSRSFIPGTQWNIANHDASYKGTQLLSKFIGNRFSFPNPFMLSTMPSVSSLPTTQTLSSSISSRAVVQPFMLLIS